MKKIVLLMMLISGIGNAQVQEPTEEVPQEPNMELTQQEFNYLSLGLKDQEEKGLDMKKGYKFLNFGTGIVGNYLFDGNIFIEEKDQLFKAVSIKISSVVTKKVLHYMVFPLYGDEYTQQYYDKIFYFDSNLKQCTLIYTSRMLKQYFNAAVELHKQKEKNNKL